MSIAHYIFEYALHFIIIAGFFFLSFSVGNLLLFNKKFLIDKPFQRIFFSSFVGQIIMLSAFALICTGGKSIFLGVPVLFGIYWLMYRKEYSFKGEGLINSYSVWNWKSVGFLLILLFIIYTWNFLAFTSIDSPYLLQILDVSSPDKDFSLYSTAGYFMQYTGIENEFHANILTDISFEIQKPYHYYDLWMNNLISTLSNGIYLKRLYLVTHPLMTFTSAVGIVALIEQFGVITSKKIILSILFMFTGGVLFSIISDIKFFNYIEFYREYFFNKTPNKISYYYSFLIAAFIMLHNRKWGVALFFLMSLVIATIVTAPSICFATAIGVLCMLLFKSITKIDFLKLEAFVLLWVIFILLFYKLAGTSDIRRSGTNFSDIINALKGSGDWVDFIKSKINFSATIFIYFIVLHFCFLILFFLCRKQYNWKFGSGFSYILIFTLMICSGGLIGRMLMFSTVNSEQIFIHTASASFNIVLFFMLSKLLSSNIKTSTQTIILSLITGVFILNIIQSYERLKNDQGMFNAYSTQYLNEIEKELTKNSDEIIMIATLRNPSGFNDTYCMYSTSNINGHYIMALRNNIGTIGIDDLDIMVTTTEEPVYSQQIEAIENGSFMQFVKRQKAKSQFISEEASQLAFLKENHFDYLIVSRELKIPEYLLKLTNHCIVDEKSGDAFYTFKPDTFK